MSALGLQIGIDFSRIDKDLNAVAARIEAVGKDHAIKIGAAAGDVASGKLSGSDLGAAVGQAGQKLAAGMASGIRAASSLMLGFTSRINVMLDKLVGSAVTLFRRIDAAMKFPAFDAFFKGAQLKLSNFSGLWRKPMSDLDLAIGGAFGGMIQKIARVLKGLIDGLAAAISGAMKDAAASVAAEFAKIGTGVRQSEASARLLAGDMQEAARAAERFGKFPAMGGAGLKTSISGPRLGANAGLTAAPAPATPTRGFGDVSRGNTAGGMKELQLATGFAIGAMGALGSITLKTGAALVSVPLRGYLAFSRLGNFLSSLGDVGKSSYHKLFEGHGLLMGSVLAATKGVMGLSSAVFHVGTLGAFRKAGEEATAFGRNVQAAGGMVRGLGSIVTSTFGQIVSAFGFIGLISGVVNFFKAGIKGAADLKESTDSAKVVFGDAYGQIEEQVNGLNKAFRTSRKEQLDIAGGFGAMAQGAGMTEEASARLANRMTKLAANLSSSKNIPFAEAAQRIQSAMAGEIEPLRRFGVTMNEDAIKAQMATNRLNELSGAIGKAGTAAKIKPKAVDLAGAMGSQTDRVKTQAANATKEVERIMRIAEKPWADAMAAATKQANLAKSKEDMKAQGDYARNAMNSAIASRKAWAAGLTGGEMPKLPDLGAKQPLKLPSDYIKASPSKAAGIKGVTEAVGEQAKMMARADLIARGLSYAEGDLERTSNSAANQFRQAGGGIAEFGIRIGQLLLPAVTLGTQGFNSMLEAALNFTESSAPTIQAWAASFTAAMDKVGMVSRNFAGIFSIAQLRVGEFAENSVRWIETIPANLKIILPWIGRNWWKIWLDIQAGTMAIFKNLVENAWNFGQAIWKAIQGQPWEFTFKPMLDGFKAVTEELPSMVKPALINVDAAVGETWDNIAKKEEARRKALDKAVVAPKKPGPLPEADKKPEYKLAAAVEIGSKEASSILARTQSAGSRGGNLASRSLSVQQQTAENTKAMVEHMKNMNALAMANKFLAVK